MLRIVLGVIAGFVLWSILWVGGDAVLSAISPGWWGRTSLEFRAAVENKTPYSLDSIVLILLLVKSVVISVISGFVTATIAGENAKSTLVLGILLVLFGIFIQSIYWNYMPLWYHLSFLLLLIPMSMLGGKLRKS
jgi:uncharacterized membrane protein (DUF485 family)